MNISTGYCIESSSQYDNYAMYYSIKNAFERKNQSDKYLSTLNSLFLSKLTDLEKTKLENLINLDSTYISNLVRSQNGSYITFFLPNIEPIPIEIISFDTKYKFTWKKKDNSTYVTFHDKWHLPNYTNFTYYDWKNININNYYNYKNCYGHEVISIEIINEVIRDTKFIC